MSGLDYAEIIAYSEDPDTMPERGRPPTPEEVKELAEFADALLANRPLESQAGIIGSLPWDFAAEKLAAMDEQRRSGILSRLPADVAQALTRRLPVPVS